jgi:hypothetical protein
LTVGTISTAICDPFWRARKRQLGLERPLLLDGQRAGQVGDSRGQCVEPLAARRGAEPKRADQQEQAQQPGHAAALE